MAQTHTIFTCQRPECRFRFPIPSNVAPPLYCPKCGSPVKEVFLPHEGYRVPRSTLNCLPPLVVLLDNIRSAYNVGSIFRTSDGASIQKIILCGITPTPDHSKVSKTSLGAEISVPWEQSWNSLETVQEYKHQGFRILAMEGGSSAISLLENLPSIQSIPVVLILGSEVSGVDPGLLSLCDSTIFIPMLGVKESLNVSVAFGIAAYFLRYAQGFS